MSPSRHRRVMPAVGESCTQDWTCAILMPTPRKLGRTKNTSKTWRNNSFQSHLKMKNTTSDDKKTRIHAQTGHFFLGKSFMINFSTQYSGETLRLFFFETWNPLGRQKARRTDESCHQGRQNSTKDSTVRTTNGCDISFPYVPCMEYLARCCWKFW